MKIIYQKRRKRQTKYWQNQEDEFYQYFLYCIRPPPTRINYSYSYFPLDIWRRGGDMDDDEIM